MERKAGHDRPMLRSRCRVTEPPAASFRAGSAEKLKCVFYHMPQAVVQRKVIVHQVDQEVVVVDVLDDHPRRRLVLIQLAPLLDPQGEGFVLHAHVYTGPRRHTGRRAWPSTDTGASTQGQGHARTRTQAHRDEQSQTHRQGQQGCPWAEPSCSAPREPPPRPNRTCPGIERGPLPEPPPSPSPEINTVTQTQCSREGLVHQSWGHGLQPLAGDPVIPPAQGSGGGQGRPGPLTFQNMKLTGSTTVGWMISRPGKMPQVTALGCSSGALVMFSPWGEVPRNNQ